ncbi:TetR/AcrR family transcriptional regulator [Okibacterium fritillariae]|uniref:Transcriptional regulator, TetR family n=1 Tax=Okibacterium fritillariae TaxID=123320 RepID=A0A1T5IYL6_9MICO|nr:TetR/AcrR family transcriptional regulator [Okibacterium fritillariae]SKC44028.1 transcriptional regulator, TetR family [Okibacterium fritillariae]
MTAKRGRPTAEERSARRDAIIDAGVEQFTQHGFDATTIDAIAAAAAVAKRTVYTYFGDKAGVFEAAVDRLHDAETTVPSAPADARIETHLDAAHDTAAAVGEAGQPAPATLLDASTDLVFRLHGDDAIALHRLVVAQAPHFPDLAARFYDRAPRRSIADLEGYTRDAALAELLYGALLGEPHRRRLLGLEASPSRPDAAAHASRTLTALGLDPLATRRVSTR